MTRRTLTVGPALKDSEEEAAADAEDAEADGIETKAQIIALVVTFAIFLFVLDLVRRRRLSERYAIIWMIAALALLVLSIWTGGLDAIADLMGIQEPANAIFIIAFAVGFLLLLNFSVVSSRLGEETKVLAQEVARLEQELRLERSLRGGEANGFSGRAAERRAGAGRAASTRRVARSESASARPCRGRREPSDGVSAAANSAAPISAVAWISRRSRKRRGNERPTSPHAASFCGSQPPTAATTRSASSVARSAGASSAKSAAG